MTKLELWSYTYRDTSSPELAKAAAKAGMTFITTTPRQFIRDGGAKGDLRKRIEDAGAKLSILDGLCSALPGAPQYSGPPTGFENSAEATLEDCIAIATQLGAIGINLVHMGGAPAPVDQMAETFAKACARARESGLNLGIEFVPGTGIADFKTAAAIVQAAGAPNGSVVFDSWHWARSGGTLEDFTDPMVATIGVVQLADRTPDQDLLPYVPMQGRKLPGQGALPLVAMMQRILAIHPDLPIGAEVLDDAITALGPEEGARQITLALRALLAEAQL